MSELTKLSMSTNMRLIIAGLPLSVAESLLVCTEQVILGAWKRETGSLDMGSWEPGNETLGASTRGKGSLETRIGLWFWLGVVTKPVSLFELSFSILL